MLDRKETQECQDLKEQRGKKCEIGKSGHPGQDVGEQETKEEKGGTGVPGPTGKPSMG